MKEDDSYRLAKVGAFVTFTLAVLVLVIAVLGRSRSLFSSKALLHTEFDNISGLVVGAPVRLAGVDIGIVQKIHFDRDPKQKKVHVVLGVQGKYLDRVREDSVAMLTSKGLLGDMLINITVGSPEFPALKPGSQVRAQESQGLTEVVSAVQSGIGEMRHLVKSVDERVQVVLSDDVARDLKRVTHSTANLLEGVERGPGLVHDLIYRQALAQNVATITGEAGQIAARLNSAVDRVDRIVAEVEKGRGTLHGLIYDPEGGKLITDLRAASSDLSAVIGEVRRGKGAIHTLLYEDKSNLIADLSATVHILRTLAEEAAQGRGTVGGLLKDPTLYEDLKLIVGKVKRNALLKTLVRAAIQSDGLQRAPDSK